MYIFARKQTKVEYLNHKLKLVLKFETSNRKLELLLAILLVKKDLKFTINNYFKSQQNFDFKLIG